MKTLATVVAMAIVLSVPDVAKTVLNNPQRVVPDYAASGVKGIPNLYIEEWTEGYPPEQTNQLSVTERVGNQRHGRR
jgi:hypothetical protein